MGKIFLEIHDAAHLFLGPSSKLNTGEDRQASWGLLGRTWQQYSDCKIRTLAIGCFHDVDGLEGPSNLRFEVYIQRVAPQPVVLR